MSKVLVIKGADFSANAIDVVCPGVIQTLQPSFISGGIVVDGASLALIPQVNIASKQSTLVSVLLGQYNSGMSGRIIVLNSAMDTIVSESEEIQFTGAKTDVSDLNIIIPQGGYVGLRTVRTTNNWHLKTDITPYDVIQVKAENTITPSAFTLGMDYGFEVFVEDD